MSRTAGSKNFNRKLLQQALEEHDFDFIVEWLAIFKDSDSSRKLSMLMHISEFIYPKRRPEDATGTPGEAPISIAVTDEQLDRLVNGAKGE